jgi:hypothetical protein
MTPAAELQVHVQRSVCRHHSQKLLRCCVCATYSAAAADAVLLQTYADTGVVMQCHVAAAAAVCNLTQQEQQCCCRPHPG